LKGTLYLIPAYLAPESSLDLSIPNYNLEVVSKLKHFIVENEKSARAFLASLFLSS
jgi:16S rRNA (cytidine1402-2'-O)-methyltransferase